MFDAVITISRPPSAAYRRLTCLSDKLVYRARTRTSASLWNLRSTSSRIRPALSENSVYGRPREHEGVNSRSDAASGIWGGLSCFCRRGALR